MYLVRNGGGGGRNYETPQKTSARIFVTSLRGKIFAPCSHLNRSVTNVHSCRFLKGNLKYPVRQQWKFMSFPLNSRWPEINKRDKIKFPFGQTDLSHHTVEAYPRNISTTPWDEMLVKT